MIFISYSTVDKELAGEIKAKLETAGVKTFLAHEDIEPTTRWQESIKEHLEECDMVLVIITPDSNESEWVQQEIGFAIAKQKTILPLAISSDPKGFLSATQALKLNGKKRLIGSKEYREADLDNCVKKILKTLGVDIPMTSSKNLKTTANSDWQISPTIEETKVSKSVKTKKGTANQPPAIVHQMPNASTIWHCPRCGLANRGNSEECEFCGLIHVEDATLTN